MRLSDRDRLISRGVAMISALHPTTIIFAGFPAVRAGRRNSAATATLRLGGFNGSAPVVFIVQKTDLPAGLVVVPQVTCFISEGVSYRITSDDSERSEPHAHFSTDIADR